MTKDSKDKCLHQGLHQKMGLAKRRNKLIMDCARTLLMERNVSQNYWREFVSKDFYTLNQVQVKKGEDKTPFEIWYCYAPNVNYFKVFGSKCYILKDSRKGKLNAKSDESIFLGHSTKRKAYRCLSSNTNKIMESANVRVDEFAEKNVEQCKKEPEDYISFVHIYEG